MQTQNIRFEGPTDHPLAGRLTLPDTLPRAYVLFAHCFTCGKDLKSANWISRCLAEHSLATLRFDFTGLGDSGGEFGETNFSTNLADLMAAANLLREDYAAPQVLIGHSLGGAAALASAANIPEVRAVATLAAPSDTAHLGEHLMNIAPEIAEDGEAEVNVMGKVVNITDQMIADMKGHNLEQAIKNLPAALMIFHSPEDQIVSYEHALRIFKLAPPRKSLVTTAERGSPAHHQPQGRDLCRQYPGRLARAISGSGCN
jgi:alpha/beta superfamily hydrolase